MVTTMSLALSYYHPRPQPQQQQQQQQQSQQQRCFIPPTSLSAILPVTTSIGTTYRSVHTWHDIFLPKGML